MVLPRDTAQQRCTALLHPVLHKATRCLFNIQLLSLMLSRARGERQIQLLDGRVKSARYTVHGGGGEDHPSPWLVDNTAGQL